MQKLWCPVCSCVRAWLFYLIKKKKKSLSCVVLLLLLITGAASKSKFPNSFGVFSYSGGDGQMRIVAGEGLAGTKGQSQ